MWLRVVGFHGSSLISEGWAALLVCSMGNCYELREKGEYSHICI